MRVAGLRTITRWPIRFAHLNMISLSGGQSGGHGKERQKQLAREHYERQIQRRLEREPANKRTAIIGSTVGVVVVVGGVVAATTLLGGGDEPTDAAASPRPRRHSEPAAAAPAAQPTAFDAATGTCDYVADTTGGPTKDVGMPPAKVGHARPKTMTLDTNLGDIVVEVVNAEKAPCTVNSLRLPGGEEVLRRHQVSPAGHRPVPDAAVRRPDWPRPTARARRTARAAPATLRRTRTSRAPKYNRGVVAMANSGADTNGSQFFLVFGDTQLPPNYTPFGTVTKGLEIIDKVNKAGVITPGPDGTGVMTPPLLTSSRILSPF